MQASRWGAWTGVWGAVFFVAIAALSAGAAFSHPGGGASPLGEEPLLDDVEGDEVEGDELEFTTRPVDELVVLPGTCPTGAAVEPGLGIDCYFDVLPGVDPVEIQFAEVEVAGEFTPCRVDTEVDGASVLVCPDLGVDRFEQGVVDVDLRVDFEFTTAAATISTEWSVNNDLALFPLTSGESVVFDGRPLLYELFAYEPVEGVFLTVRERGREEILTTIEVEVPDTFDATEIKVEPDLPLGRYRVWPCIGASPDTCEERSGGRPFQVINGEPLELIPGHNRRSAERINVLFVSSGLERVSEGDRSRQLPAVARTMLAIDGPVAVDINGAIVGDDEKAFSLLWGPMAIEPLASHVDRFNFWYLPDEISEEEGILFSGWQTNGDAGFDLPNLHITALYYDGLETASDARFTTFESAEPDDVPLSGRIRFGDARVWMSPYDSSYGAATLAHEWGHGLFGLRDEYYGFDGRPIAVGYPNCAPDIETAEVWWGDVIGEVDPFVDRVIELQNERLEDPSFLNQDLVERTTISITEGGCYSDTESTEVYRPSIDSLMNSEVPVFGTVNRARVQEVLDRFSGRGPMQTLDDLTLACEAETGFINCRGELETYLDRPLSIVAIDSNPCEFGSGRPLPGNQVGPVPVTCTMIGPPGEPVQLSFKGDYRSIEVVDVNPPPPPVPMQSRIIAEAESGAEAEDSGSSGSGRTVAIGVLLCVAAIALGFVERRRRAGEAQ